jgi:hypothetical protein
LLVCGGDVGVNRQATHVGRPVVDRVVQACSASKASSQATGVGAAHGFRAERIEAAVELLQRWQHAAEAHVTEGATKANPVLTEELSRRRRRGRLAGALVEAEVHREERVHATAQILTTREREVGAAGVAGRHVPRAVRALNGGVDATRQGDGRLRRRSTSECAQHSESEQRFLHVQYLQG